MKVRKLIILVLITVVGYPGFGQTASKGMEGSVSFKSSQNIYVKLPSTDQVNVGDTLMMEMGGELRKALVVRSKSSMTCVCTKLEGIEVEVGSLVYFTSGSGTAHPGDEDKETRKNPEGKPAMKNGKEKRPGSSRFSGRISARSYGVTTSADNSDYLKMRYLLSLKVLPGNKSGFSGESYIAFSHRSGDWSAISDNIYHGLKVYNLNTAYTFKSNTTVSIGRKINRKISNVGAIDGIQLDQKMGNFTLGVFGGFRPDYTDYGFSTALPQYGSYLSYSRELARGNIDNTLAFVEQKNGSHTDRRFLYFQHSNSILKNFFLFTSVEMNLYTVVDSAGQGDFGLSSFYVMARYRINRKLSFNVSYDIRNNLIYYETYKNFLDQLIEDQTRQGLNISANYRVFNHVMLGFRGSYRYRKGDASPGTNLAANVYFSKMPVEGMRSSININLLNTLYLNGGDYGARLSQSFNRGKMSAGVYYRFFNGRYMPSETETTQHMLTFDYHWRISKTFRLGLSYEGMTEKGNLTNRIYGTVTYRF